jgi:hypothetical protein
VVERPADEPGPTVDDMLPAETHYEAVRAEADPDLRTV